MTFYGIKCPNCGQVFDVSHVLQSHDENKITEVRCPTEKQYPEDRGGCGHIFKIYCFKKEKVGDVRYLDFMKVNHFHRSNSE